MFRYSPVRIRAVPRGLLFFASLIFTVDASADSGHFRAREETLSGGMHIAQRVDAVAFPQFEGTHPEASSPDAPSVGAGHLRSIRALVPLKTDDAFAFALPDHSAYISVDLTNRHVLVTYGGRSVDEAAAPFVQSDKELQWQGNTLREWTQVTSTGRRLSDKATHALVTLYVVPRFDGKSPAAGTPNLVATVSEATVHGMHVVQGRSLADGVMLAVSDNDWTQWREKAIRAGTLPDLHTQARNLPADFTSRPAWVEQRTLALHSESNARPRDKRCLSDIAYQVSNLMLPALLEVYFGRSDLCALDPHPNQDIAAPLPLVIVTNPDDVPRGLEPAVFEAVALEPAQLNAEDAFDAAMNVQFCNTNHPRAAGTDACTDADHRAAAALGNLSPARIDQLLAQLTRMFDPDQAGTAMLQAGDAELDRWLNADLVRAENALTAAQAIVHVSDVRTQPNEPIKDNKNKSKNKKRKLVKASCFEDEGRASQNPGSEDGFQLCVGQAKRQLREEQSTIGLTPFVERHDVHRADAANATRYHLRGTPEFDRMTRAFRNTGRQLPRGLADNQFAMFTAAIARDPAAAGDTTGFVFINDPALRGGAQRFPYGVEHIWAPGGGGGDNAGHRDDWVALNGLSVKTRDMMIQVVMAALTDPHATYEQGRARNGNVVRTFTHFTFQHGGTLFAIRNVRVVLGQNGMVVTAYPLRGASAQSLSM